MKMQSQSTLYGISAVKGEVEGNKFDSTIFYLPADMAATANKKAFGIVTVPYKFGDSTEIDKWAHLSHSFPPGGIPVLCEFDVIAGRDAQGKDAAKIVLVGIRPISSAPAQKAA